MKAKPISDTKPTEPGGSSSDVLLGPVIAKGVDDDRRCGERPACSFGLEVFVEDELLLLELQRAADVDHALLEVDVAPAEAGGLTGAEAEGHHEEQERVEPMAAGMREQQLGLLDRECSAVFGAVTAAVASVILAVMIVPIMIAIIVDALRAVPKAWTEGAAALGVNRWRVMWTIGLRTARPAIIAAVILASARALGEAIMLAMVSGSIGFIPNPADGLTFFLEPVRPLAAAIVDNAEGLSVVPFGQTIYAFAFVLLVSSMILSIGGWLAKRPMRRYGVRP